jgi:hypothetical protein
MQRTLRRLSRGLLVTVLISSAFAQRALTWHEVRAKFEAANPTPRAGQISIDELRAQEITAYLRPIRTSVYSVTKSIHSRRSTPRPLRIFPAMDISQLSARTPAQTGTAPGKRPGCD